MIPIPWSEFQPYVSFANQLVCTPGFSFGPRIIYDHQFIFVVSGRGYAQIQDRLYTANAGDLFYYGPGISHRFTADHLHPFVLYGLHFSLNGTLPDNGKNRPVRLTEVGEQHPPYKSNLLILGDQGREQLSVPEYSSPGTAWVKPYLSQMIYYFNKESILSHLHNRSLFTQFIIELQQWTNRQTPLGAEKPKIIDELQQKLQLHAAQPYDRMWLREWTHYHESHAARLFHEHTGVSPHEYFLEHKIELAKQLLVSSDETIGMIADRLHIGTIHYFSRMFKTRTGYSPRDFRKLRQMI